MYKTDEILSSLNDAVWVVDLASLKFIYTNPRFTELMGPLIEVNKTSMQQWLNLIHPDDLEFYKTRLDNIFTEKNVTLEYRLKANGKFIWVCEKIIQLSGSEPGKGEIAGILIDITHSKEVNKKLLKSEETYRYLFLNNPNPLWVYDLETLKFLAVNDTAINKYGYSREEFLKMSILDIRPPEDHEELLKHVKTDAGNFKSENYWRHIKKNREIIWVDITGQRLSYQGKDAVMILASDVTDKARVLEEMVRRDKLLSSLINSQTHYVMRLDPKGNFTFVNSTFSEKLGYSEEELIGHHFKKITLPEDYDVCEKALQSCIDNPGKIIPLNHQKVDVWGNTFWTSWEFMAITNLDNDIVDIQGFGRDISEDLQIKEDLETNEINLNALINNTDDLIWSIDKDYRLISANTSYKVYIRNRSGTLPEPGNTVFISALNTELNERWKSYYDRALGGERYTIIYNLYGETNKRRQAEISFNPITDNNGEIIGVGCFAHDITDRMNFEEQILAQNETLKKIASLASHEIRGPVASMLGLLSLFDRSIITDPHNMEIFNYLEKSMEQLDSVIHKIVEITYSLEPEETEGNTKYASLQNLSGNE